MRILYTNFHEHNGGGHDTYIYGLAQGLSGAHSISVAVPKTSHLYEKLSRLEKVRVFPLPFRIKIHHLARVFESVRALRKILQLEKYDIVHVNGSADHTLVMLATAGMRSPPKIIFTKHNTLPVKWGARIRFRYATDAMIAVSPSAQAIFSPKNSPPISVIFNGVDTDICKPLAPDQSLLLREKWGIAPDAFVIGSIAGTPLYKGWGLLLQAVAQIRDLLPTDIKIVIAGEFPSATLIDTYVTQLGLTEQVVFTGWVSDVKEIVPLFDVGFVLSYQVETISFACREMMAMGKPVLVSDYGDLTENITDTQDGWVTKCGDVADIKKCVLEIIAERTHLPERALQARKKAVAVFSQVVWIADTLAVYRSCLE
jgi:glycosyltransferase involved in cell wall biosynthesis